MRETRDRARLTRVKIKLGEDKEREREKEGSRRVLTSVREREQMKGYKLG